MSVVSHAATRPVAVVLQLDSQDSLGEVPGTEVQLPDPLLDGERTEDEVTGILDVESVVG